MYKCIQRKERYEENDMVIYNTIKGMESMPVIATVQSYDIAINQYILYDGTEYYNAKHDEITGMIDKKYPRYRDRSDEVSIKDLEEENLESVINSDVAKIDLKEIEEKELLHNHICGKKSNTKDSFTRFLNDICAKITIENGDPTSDLEIEVMDSNDGESKLIRIRRA